LTSLKQSISKNGREAVDFFLAELRAKRTLSAMIFDLTVPGGMGGKAAIEEIRKSDTDIPVFVASGYADDPITKNPTEYGFTASIFKPFVMSDLSDMLERHLKKHQ
jgi:two-component system cell cycle sensor histidine kinase/response regulator CckA